MIRAPEVPGRVALKLPAYAPSASRIVPPGETVVSADLSWRRGAHLDDRGVRGPGAGQGEATDQSGGERDGEGGAGAHGGCLPVGKIQMFPYLNEGCVSERVAQ
ncbi:hypothetical protein SBADM41S_10924 [Streptomyces badius]